MSEVGGRRGSDSVSEVRGGGVTAVVGYEHLSQILMSLAEPEAMYASSELKHTVLRDT